MTTAAFPAASLDRPALQELLAEVAAGRIDIIVVYKVDRLTRSLADFAKLVELFDQHRVSFVSVTQSFNTTTSMGRLTLNVLLSFAQFEREVTGERIRDKIAASKRKGIWIGGPVPLGYASVNKKLVVVPEEAETVRHDLPAVSGTRVDPRSRGGPGQERHSDEAAGASPPGTSGAGSALGLVASPTSCAIDSSSVRSSIAGKFIAENRSPFSIARSSTPCRRSSQPVRTSGS